MNNIENRQSAAEQIEMKDIPGWEGLYACTTSGQICSQ